MNCTECNKETNHLHGERWNSKIGHIINKDEALCTKCAKKRKGFRTLSQINQERKSQLK